MSYSSNGSRESTYRPSRPRKRRYYGNKSDEAIDEKNDSSASAQKLRTADCEEVPVKLTHVYRIIEFVSVFSALQDIVQCKFCKREMTR